VSVPHYTIRARVSTERPEEIRSVLRGMFPTGAITLTGDPNEIVLRGSLDGANAAELNRTLLSEMRRVDRRTRLRAEWSLEGRTEKFFDYVAKGVRGPADGVRPE
jgi:hypothetical protein